MDTTNNNTNTGNGTNAATSFTIDLEDSANAALKTNGGYVVVKGIVIAKDVNGNYVAATQICSHAGRAQVVFDGSSNQFYCNAHGARFTTAGAGLNSAGSRGLAIYKTGIEMNLLRIYL